MKGSKEYYLERAFESLVKATGCKSTIGDLFIENAFRYMLLSHKLGNPEATKWLEECYQKGVFCKREHLQAMNKVEESKEITDSKDTLDYNNGKSFDQVKENRAHCYFYGLNNFPPSFFIAMKLLDITKEKDLEPYTSLEKVFYERHPELKVSQEQSEIKH